MNKRIAMLAAVVAALGTALYFIPSKDAPQQVVETAETGAASDEMSLAMVSVEVPELTGNAVLGETIFNSLCAACHGKDAAGQGGIAPPLVHRIYEPGHHGEEAFQRAVLLGVRSHHWGFGDMPAVPGLTRGDVKMIVAYIRQLQRANGIN